jgi:REP element-mobilizing transposase RayT
MARIPRFERREEPTVYHVISRSALPGLPIDAADRDYLLQLIYRLSRLYYVDVLGFCLMGNHFHLVTRVYPESELDDEELRRRYKGYYGEDQLISGNWLDWYRERLTSLGAFIKDIKQGFTRYYNRKHNRRGYFWGERFKSVIVQDGRTLVNLLAYVDLNPIRAGIVRRPEEYRWCSLGYHLQTGNAESLLSLEFGLADWNEYEPEEIVRKYREFVYEAGAVDSGKGASIDQKVVDRERRRKYRMSRVERFLHRSRYFTDSGIIGSKDFVGQVFDTMKHLLGSKDERRFTPIGGMNGVYSMKRLT